MTHQHCRTCCRLLPRDGHHFYRVPKNRDGLSLHCRSCENERHNMYRVKVPVTSVTVSDDGGGLLAPLSDEELTT